MTQINYTGDFFYNKHRMSVREF